MLRLAVICTDKGQHPRSRLGELDITTTGHLMAANALALGSVPGTIEPDDSSVQWEPGERVQVRCRRCGRHVQWRSETARAVIAALWEADHSGGIAWLDISALP